MNYFTPSPRKAKNSDAFDGRMSPTSRTGSYRAPRRPIFTVTNFCFLFAGILIHALYTDKQYFMNFMHTNNTIDGGKRTPPPFVAAEVEGGPYYPKGKHLLVDLQGASGDVLNDRQGLEDTVVSIIKNAGMHMLSVSSHQLEPQGVSVVAAISESHLTIHTWPEHGAALIDLFTCGDSTDMLGILPTMVADFGGQLNMSKWSLVKRGSAGVSDLDKSVLSRQHIKKRNLASVKSEMQKIEVWSIDSSKEFEIDHEAVEEQELDAPVLSGKNTMLFLDDVLQSGTLDEHTYHETLVHPAMIAHERGPERVAILGGGEGATLREVLKYTSVKKVDMIEIDEKVIEISQKYLPSMGNCSWASNNQGTYLSCFDEPRTNVVNEDVISFLQSRFDFENCNDEDNKYDVIIMDLLDPEATSASDVSDDIYNANFFQHLSCALKSDGVLAIQIGEAPSGTALDPNFAKKLNLIQDIAKQFYPGGTFVYQQYVDTFNGEWTFSVSCKSAECSNRWMAEIGAVDSALHARLDPRIMTREELAYGKLQFFDGATMQKYHYPPKCLETHFCQLASEASLGVTPKECMLVNPFLSEHNVKPSDKSVTLVKDQNDVVHATAARTMNVGERVGLLEGGNSFKMSLSELRRLKDLANTTKNTNVFGNLADFVIKNGRTCETAGGHVFVSTDDQLVGLDNGCGAHASTNFMQVEEYFSTAQRFNPVLARHPEIACLGFVVVSAIEEGQALATDPAFKWNQIAGSNQC
eukprot:m.7521 g.7521  ORF g.7521 m.7521 type:complete len:751 (+) comp3728_c0_seq1:201-2453(+)